MELIPGKLYGVVPFATNRKYYLQYAYDNRWHTAYTVEVQKNEIAIIMYIGPAGHRENYVKVLYKDKSVIMCASDLTDKIKLG